VLERVLRISAGVVVALCICSSLAACATSHVQAGNARAPVMPDRVRLFLEPPAIKYQEIAVIDASSKHSFSFTAEGKADVVIRRLKEEAAKLGANGVVLQDIADGPVSSVATGVGTESMGARGTISLGIIGTGLVSEKYGRGVAIYTQ
jgi:hypothetical protein